MEKEKVIQLLCLFLGDCAEILKMISAGAFLAGLVPQQNGASPMSIPIGFACAITVFWARVLSAWVQEKHK